MSNKLKDDNDDRKYFIVTPHLVWALSRDTYDYTLWSVIKMIAGEESKCILGTRDLATLAMMSTGKVCDCRQYLLKQGLLKGKLETTSTDQSREVWHLSVPDLWERNMAWRAEVGHKLKDRIQYKKDQKVRHHSFDEQGRPRSPDECLRSPDECLRSPSRIKEEPEKEPKMITKEEEEEIVDNLGNKVIIPLKKEIKEAVAPEMTFTSLTNDDDPVPAPHFNKSDPFFKKIMGCLVGTPTNLQGQERKQWQENVQRRAAEDPVFRNWCIWQAKNNANGKTVKVFIQYVTSEGDFAAWREGKFISTSELDKLKQQASRGTPHSRQDRKKELDSAMMAKQVAFEAEMVEMQQQNDHWRQYERSRERLVD